MMTLLPCRMTTGPRAAALCAALLLAAVSARAAPMLRLAAAADLSSCIDGLNAGFTQEAGAVEIKISTGASGTLFAQISQGAPFDVFLSADVAYPMQLAKAGLTDGGRVMVYAYGRLTLRFNADLPVTPGMAMLSDPRIRHLAIANPELAPYGRAAQAALEATGLWEQVKPKLVYGENLTQTAQFIDSGNAEAAFVGTAQAANSRFRSWPVPTSLYPVIEQGAVVTQSGRRNPLAARYLAFLRGGHGRAILRGCGYGLPAPS